MSKRNHDPQKTQKKFAAVIALVLCGSLVLSLMAGLLAY